MTDERIFEYFAANSGALLNDIAALVGIPSVKGEPEEGAPYGIGPRAALSAAASIAQNYGLEAKILGDRVCVIELGEGEPELGILAHLDVVPPAGKWEQTEPYEMVCKEGILYGRGVADNKGPAVAALYALRAAKELDFDLSKKVQLILGSDEENGSDDIRWYLENYKMPPKVFTPDGAFPLVNTEKGKLDMTVSIEPWEESEGARVISMRGGSVANAVPAECEAVVCGISAEEAKAAADGIGAEFVVTEGAEGIKIVCTGKACHASLPDEGINAITAMLELLSKLTLANSKGISAIRALSAALPFGDNGGRKFGADCADDISGKLTVNLGVISYGAESGLKAKIDCRVPVCGDGKAISEKFADAIGDKATVTVTGLLKPHNTPEESDFVQGLLEIYEDYTGEKGEALYLGGLTYVHEVEGGVAFGCEFPGTETHAHEPDECMPVDELVLAGQMFAQAIADFCE